MPDTTQPREFPPELVDLALRNLQPVNWGESWPIARDERQTLSACALVSRSWYFLARPYLFGSVVYSFEADSHEFDLESIETARWAYYPDAKLYHSAKHIPMKTLGMFFEFLYHSPSIASTIRQLRLVCYPAVTTRTPAEQYGLSIQDHVNMDRLMDLLQMMSNLDVLHTLNIVPSYGYTPDKPCVSLRALHFDQYTWSPHLLGMGRFFAGFARVNYLKISFNTLYWVYPRGSDLRWLSVKSLEFVHAHDARAIEAWLPELKASPTRKSLRELAFTQMDYEGISGVKVYIQAFKAQIQCLTLMFKHSAEQWSHFPQATLNLTQVSSLRELTLGWSFVTQYATPASTLFTTAILEYFGTLTLTPHKNTQLKRITFFLDGKDYQPTVAATEALWETHATSVAAFETVLAGLVDAFSLGGIRMKCGIACGAEEGTDLMRKIFPNLSRDDLLVFGDD